MKNVILFFSLILLMNHLAAEQRGIDLKIVQIRFIFEL